MNRLVEQYGKDVKFVFRHFPLSKQAQAYPAAEAVEAAGEQGAFWQMLDGLYAEQKDLGPELFQRKARELGLDMAAFNASIQSGRNKARIDADLAQGEQLGVRGTPTFWLSGRPLQPSSAEDLEEAVAEALAQSRG